MDCALDQLIAKFHYTGPTGPDWTGPDQTKTGYPTKSAGSARVADKVRGLCPVGSGRARVVEFSYNARCNRVDLFGSVQFSSCDVNNALRRVSQLPVFAVRPLLL